MITIRKSSERGLGDRGWLKSRHTFSFADYYDPNHMGFKTLRVINEDKIEGGSGFPTHSHRDMEIISYVMSGALEHQDSMGNKAIIYPNEVQRMRAGTGVTHSEHNHLKDEETHFYQIWIIPNKEGLTPGYGQKSFEAELKDKKLVLVASQDGREGSISIAQDADVYLSRLKSGDQLEFKLRSGRGVWVQAVKGRVNVNDQEISRGDGLSASDEELLKFKALEESEVMVFDLG